jgi:hypothetical protein
VPKNSDQYHSLLRAQYTFSKFIPGVFVSLNFFLDDEITSWKGDVACPYLKGTSWCKTIYSTFPKTTGGQI